MFAPSIVARVERLGEPLPPPPPVYDREPAFDERNIAYQTEAELPQSITPHLKAAMYYDEQRRNYRIVAGGDVVYRDEDTYL